MSKIDSSSQRCEQKTYRLPALKRLVCAAALLGSAAFSRSAHGEATDFSASILTGSSSATSHTYTLQTVDVNGDNQTSGGDEFTLEVSAIDIVVGLPLSIPMTDQGNGQYTASFTADQDTFYASTSSSMIVSGVFAEYYDNPTWRGSPVGTRVEDVVFFKGPGHLGLSGGNFRVSAQWTGFLVPPTTETYTFKIYHDDGYRMQIGSNPLTKNGRCCRTETLTYNLVAGVYYDFYVALWTRGAPNNISIRWQTPSIPLEYIPASAYFHKQNLIHFPESSASQTSLTYNSTTVENHAYAVSVQVRDNAGNKNNVSTDLIIVTLTRSDGTGSQEYTETASHISYGNYSVTLYPTVSGIYTLSATLNGVSIVSDQVIVYCDFLAWTPPDDTQLTVEMGYTETISLSPSHTDDVKVPSDSCPLILSTPDGSDLFFFSDFDMSVTTVDATLAGSPQVRTVSMTRSGLSESLDFTVSINVIPSCAFSALRQVRAPRAMSTPLFGNIFQDLSLLFTHEFADILPVDTCVITFEIKTTGDTSYLSCESSTDDFLLTTNLHLYPHTFADVGRYSTEVVASYLYYSDQVAPSNTLTSSPFRVTVEEKCYSLDEADCHCDWTEMVKNSQEVEVPVYSEGEQVRLNLNQILPDMSYPDCYLSGIENPMQISYYAFQLIEDNEGRLYTDTEFREVYKNENDAKLDDPPTSMHIAEPLGQESLIFSQADPTYLNFSFKNELNGGKWRFQVKACTETFEIDCDYGVNEVTLNIKNVCIGDEAEKFAQNCSVRDNQPPYFISFSEAELYEIKREDPPLKIQLSDYIDEDGDRVELSVSLDDEMQEWITFDKDYRRFEFRPVESTPLGLTAIKVELDDGTDQSEYQLRIWAFTAQSAVLQAPFKSQHYCIK